MWSPWTIPLVMSRRLLKILHNDTSPFRPYTLWQPNVPHFCQGISSDFSWFQEGKLSLHVYTPFAPYFIEITKVFKDLKYLEQFRRIENGKILSKKLEKCQEDVKIMDLSWENIWPMLTSLYIQSRKERIHLSRRCRGFLNKFQENVQSWVTTYHMQRQGLSQWVKANRKTKGTRTLPSTPAPFSFPKQRNKGRNLVQPRSKISVFSLWKCPFYLPLIIIAGRKNTLSSDTVRRKYTLQWYH